MKMRYAILILLLGWSASLHAAVRPVIVQASKMSNTVTREREFPLEDLLKEGRKEQIAREVSNQMIPIHRNQLDGSSVGQPPSALLPAPTLKFQGEKYDDFNPPDPIMAVGPSHVMAVVNTAVNIYDKSGHRVKVTGFRQWFASLPGPRPAFFFDPKVMYDQYTGHYIFLCLAGGQGHSWLLFSASRTSDAMGEWGLWSLDMQSTNGNHSQIFADFPGLGIDSQGIYITANMFNRQSQFVFAKLRILKKSQVYSFAGLTWRDFVNLKDSAQKTAINVQPVHSFGLAPVEYLVETDAVSGNKVTIWTITNPVTTPVLKKRGVLVSSYQVPPGAVQKGGGSLVNTGDSGVLNAVYRDGSIYTAHNIAHNWGSGIVSAIRYYQISTAGRVLQEITYGKDRLFYFYPVVMPDSHGNVALVFNRCGASEFAGIHFTGRRTTDAPGTLQNSTMLFAGRSNYNTPQPGSGVNLWGDYNGIALDSDDSLWIFSEYVDTPLHWATEGARIHF